MFVSNLIILVALGVLAAVWFLLERNYRKRLKHQQEQIERLMGIKLVLASLIDLKDPYTEGHSRNVRDLTFEFSQYLDLPLEACEEYALAAELHDIGKIGIPDSILKKPGVLISAEYSEIRDHPRLGADSLSTLQGFDTVRNIILHHHEHYDGTGYPQGLSGDQIPLGSRIIALTDSFDAMLHGREYRPPIPFKDVVRILEDQSGKQFDPQLCEQYLQFLQSGIQSGSRDPVCGMAVSLSSNLLTLEGKERRWLFCSQTCLKAFKEAPEKYLWKPFFSRTMRKH